jgi:intein/homing endonuclease
MLKIRKVHVEPTDVYDITVEDTHCFFANNLLVLNCEILLPTQSFKSLDDEGEFKLTLDNGQEISLPGQHKVLLKDGSKKKVRELSENDDIENLLI